MAGYSPLARTTAIQPVSDLGGWVSLHSADPATTGINEVAGAPYARKLSTFPPASSGFVTGSQVELEVPEGAEITITHVGIWTAETDGDFITGQKLTTPEAYSTTGGIIRVTPTLIAQNPAGV